MSSSHINADPGMDEVEFDELDAELALASSSAQREGAAVDLGVSLPQEAGGHALSDSSTATASQHRQLTAPTYSLRNVIASTATVDSWDVFDMATNVTKNHCFRKSFLWGAAVGGLFSLHRLKQGGSFRRAANDGFLATLGVFAFEWYSCRSETENTMAVFKAYYANMKSKEKYTPSKPLAAVDGTGTDEEWRKDIVGGPSTVRMPAYAALLQQAAVTDDDEAASSPSNSSSSSSSVAPGALR